MAYYVISFPRNKPSHSHSVRSKSFFLHISPDFREEKTSTSQNKGTLLALPTQTLGMAHTSRMKMMKNARPILKSPII